jgi:hypothetical protein
MTAIKNSIKLAAAAASLILAWPAMSQSLDGFWRSEGYGYVFAVHAPRWNAFEVSATTCVPGFTATMTERAAPGREATFEAEGARKFFVRSSSGDNRKVLHFEGSASDMRMNRIESMPAICNPPTQDTPENNFTVFAETWREHYISFALRHVDWDKVIAENRGKISAKTSPAQLFDILKGMIEPLGDAHTRLRAINIGKNFSGFRLGIVASPPSVFATTDRIYFKQPFERFCNDQIAYDQLAPDIGYLRLLSFESYTAKGDFESELACLNPALDKIFSHKTIKALIIDVRANTGGADPLGLAIASRLATKPYLAYTKKARADPFDRTKWTDQDPDLVVPRKRPGFNGAVVELTGPSTVSAGETFTQALTGRMPRVTRIGENTQGVFSDILTRHLPNGWTFGLPNEIFVTDGKAFDGDGIPPGIRVPVFAPADLRNGRDPALAAALTLIREQP